MSKKKKCFTCGFVLHESLFHTRKDSPDGRRSQCRDCCNAATGAQLVKHRNNKERYCRIIFTSRKSKALKRGIVFNLVSYKDIEWPTHCPMLGTKIRYRIGGKNGLPMDDSPSLDRINPKKGYVKGNVQVISSRANMIKSSSTLKEFGLIYEYRKRSEGKVRNMPRRVRRGRSSSSAF